MTSLLFALLCCTPAFAWGPEGHRIVADIARDHLTPRARLGIVQLLGDDDLAAISTWADEIRRDRPETYGWHFVDIPWNANGFDRQRDCYHPAAQNAASYSGRHNCVVDRVEMFASVLADSHAPRSYRVEALKLLVHFVADIHQPLHAIAEAHGGNEIHVSEFGSEQCGPRACTLHNAWDMGLMRHTRESERKYVARLERANIPQESRLNESTPEQWANESFRIAHEVWLKDGASIDESYYGRNIHIVDQQLARAGLRLAALLNRAMGN